MSDVTEVLRLDESGLSLMIFPLFPFAQALPIPTVPTPVPTSPPIQVPEPPKRPIPPVFVLPPQEDIAPQESLPRQEILQVQEIRTLPGQLDEVPVFNSNSPEMVLDEGVLLSTLPPEGKLFPKAHLNYAFNGRFDIFSHHISRASTPSQIRSLFQGILVQNPGTQAVTIEVLQAASYLTRPDALFVDLPDYQEDPIGTVFSGPGSRVMSDILRGRRQGSLPTWMVIPPGESRMLMNLPIPAGLVTPTSNGRSTMIRLRSSGPVYLASLAMYAPRNLDGTERIPTQAEWEQFALTANLAGPRDLPPTPPTERRERVIYGRVAGVAQGSQWQAKLTDSPKSDRLTIPRPGTAFSYGISTLPRGTFGTGQIQSAKMLVRYPDTAYLANGNYGIQYSLTLPLHNNTRQAQKVALLFETPIKHDRSKQEALFFNPPEPKIFFRGTVRVQYQDDAGVKQTKFVHLVQRRGQQGSPLVTLKLPAGDRRLVEVDFLYPPDATPPQLLTVSTLKD
ncbi:DUF3370 domain-containing protein [Alkalinema pantanalense CENA528]|uniref:DUF3370 domain-containing protein n=1 Tax=Alkalinema pantanalense TaxID=1620705 RepID=UPI003D6E7BF2